jgi:hypothetical protein
MIENRDDDDGEPPAEDAAPADGARGLFWEFVGCLVPLAAVAAFLFLAVWGYRSLFGPQPAPPVEAGEVQSIALQSGDGKDYAGRRCRVYAEWVAIEADGTTVLIPRDRVQSLRLVPPR